MEAVKEKPQLQKYPAYKDSGVEWLGDIPEHWEVKRLKSFLKVFGRIGFRGYTVNDLVNEGEGAITISPSNFGESDLQWDKSSYLSWEKFYESPEIMVKEGDLLIVKTASIGKIGYVKRLPYKATVNPQILVVKKIQQNRKFLYYQFLSRVLQIQLMKKKIGSTIFTISEKKILNALALIPSQQEQAAIVEFLDEKCGKIDTSIAQKQTLIELLKERKQIIIQNAVTKGLDPKVKLKDSGVEWIGKIPEHWEVKKIKHLIKNSFSGGTPSTDKLDYWDGGIPWISSVDVKIDYLRITAREISFKGLSNSSAKLAPKGAIIFVTRSGILQHTFPISILQKQMAINQDIKCLILNHNILPEYFRQTISGNNNKILAEVRQQAATVESIDMEAFFNLQIAIPPKIEQKQISEYIEKITQKFLKATDLQVQQFEKLKEYKSSLIDAAVTGKIKVS